jgi:hypothetical protein
VISYELASAILEQEARGPACLTVLYDETCPMCRQLRTWLASQWVVVRLELLAAASPEARRRYPLLDHERTKTVLTGPGLCARGHCQGGSLSPSNWGHVRGWHLCESPAAS